MDYYEASSSQVQEPDEHTFLCGYSRVRRYGTTKSLQETTPQHYFIYTVQPTDTLQGIALRHNCSVSVIIRMNKLWSADALHLKESIRIPLKAANGNVQHMIPEPSSSASKIDEVQQSESLNEILSRIDKSIKKTSRSVTTMQRHSSLNQLDQPPSRHDLFQVVAKSKNSIT